jgi:hypothetical protein
MPLLLGSRLMAYDSCFTSVSGRFEPCKMVCDLPDHIGVVYPNFEVGTATSGINFFYRGFNKDNFLDQTTRAIIPEYADFSGGCGMGSGGCHFDFKEFSMFELKKFDPSKAWHGSIWVGDQVVKDGQLPRGDYVGSGDCRYFPKLLASCVTDKRTIYAILDGSTVEYQSFDYDSKHPSRPSTEIKGGKVKSSLPDHSSYSLKFTDPHGWGYELNVSSSPAISAPILIVSKDGKPFRTDACSSYTVDPEHIESTMQDLKQVAAN